MNSVLTDVTAIDGVSPDIAIVQFVDDREQAAQELDVLGRGNLLPVVTVPGERSGGVCSALRLKGW